MIPAEIEQALRQTLADEKLSGSEKHALAALLGEEHLGEQQLALYRHRAFELAAEKVGDPEVRQVLSWLQGVMKLLTPRPAEDVADYNEACFAPEHDCPGRIIRLFADARATADVCVFTITDDRLADAVVAAHRRGVKVRVITDNDKAFDRGSDIGRFGEEGIPLLVDQSEFHMHHKFAVFDGRLLMTGSYNWTRGAARDNKENFLVTGNRKLVHAYDEAFQRLWRELGGK